MTAKLNHDDDLLQFKTMCIRHILIEHSEVHSKSLSCSFLGLRKNLIDTQLTGVLLSFNAGVQSEIMKPFQNNLKRKLNPTPFSKSVSTKSDELVGCALVQGAWVQENHWQDSLSSECWLLAYKILI